MKKIFSSAAIALALLSPSMVHAFVYHDEDLLLIFRKPSYDNVEFNLGSVSNFLNKAEGYSVTVTNFNLALATNTLGALDADGRFILVASTDKLAASKRAWIGNAETNTVPLDRTASQWQNLWSQISGYGVGAQTFTLSNATPSAVIPPANLYSFDYIASSGGLNPLGLPKLNGYSTFVVEQTIPNPVKLWEIHPSGINPKPAATLIGTFTLTSGGVLTFVAGTGTVTPPAINHITRSNGVVSVTFTTTSGGNYQLRYTNTLGGPISTWPAVGGTVAGDGTSKTLTHTNAAGAGFYGVSRSP